MDSSDCIRQMVMDIIRQMARYHVCVRGGPEFNVNIYRTSIPEHRIVLFYIDKLLYIPSMTVNQCIRLLRMDVMGAKVCVDGFRADLLVEYIECHVVYGLVFTSHMCVRGDNGFLHMS